MEIAEIMQEVRKLPDDQLLALAEQIDDEAAKVVDQRFESLAREAAIGFAQLQAGQTVTAESKEHFKALVRGEL
ncbi:MAG: type II toxin-antitoxin system ParD family antitoxin [Luteolibacter sp.]